ncbi:MAG TPA: hypothetical protein PLB78_14510 [Anaerolineae bacterium]|nr:hypothetical protein [Anaerolineae bacterium]
MLTQQPLVLAREADVAEETAGMVDQYGVELLAASILDHPLEALTLVVRARTVVPVEIEHNVVVAVGIVI